MLKKNVAVILAAGNGERSGFDVPKQLVKLAGKPVVEHTIAKFQEADCIDEIIIVTNNSCLSKMEEIVNIQNFSKVKRIINGGKERYESSLAAINAYAGEAHLHKINLIFHDAVRPLVSERIIRDVVQALEYYHAVDVVVPSTDTIISADPISNTIDGIPARYRLRNGQTPQAFDWHTINEAYQLALKDPDFKTTDDCGVVHKYLPQTKIFLVSGDITNIKLTYKEDYHVMDKLVQMNSRRAVWNDVSFKTLSRLRGKVLVVIGGTSGIGEEIAAIASAHEATVKVASRSTGVDVTDIRRLTEFFNQVKDEEGRIDYVVNAAAILLKQPLALMAYSDALRSIQTNYLGAVHVAMAAYPHLKETGGHLLNFTSSSYTYGRAYYSLYSSSKAAVVNLTQALAEEWHTQNIRVNCVNPERTDTPMRRRAFGIEPPRTLLSAKAVALFSLSVLVDQATGHVFDIVNHEANLLMKNGRVMDQANPALQVAENE